MSANGLQRQLDLLQLTVSQGLPVNTVEYQNRSAQRAAVGTAQHAALIVVLGAAKHANSCGAGCKQPLRQH
jgi:hypothetical protein